MAPGYDSVYDQLGLCRFPAGISGRNNDGVFIMDYQLIFAVVIGVLALLYILRRLVRQTAHIEKDPKCEDCPVPESRQEAEKRKQR
jgi:hypothetical protein